MFLILFEPEIVVAFAMVLQVIIKGALLPYMLLVLLCFVAVFGPKHGVLSNRHGPTAQPSYLHTFIRLS